MAWDFTPEVSGEGGASSHLHLTHTIAMDGDNEVESVVLCAQEHTRAVTRFMVGFGVADYTGIIERGHTQTQE